jgi:hypothetical protein
MRSGGGQARGESANGWRRNHRALLRPTLPLTHDPRAPICAESYEILRTTCSGSLVIMEESAFELTLESPAVARFAETVHQMSASIHDIATDVISTL